MLESLGTSAFVIKHPFSYLSIPVEFNPLILPIFLFFVFLLNGGLRIPVEFNPLKLPFFLFLIFSFWTLKPPGTRAFVIRHPFSYLSIRVEFNPLILPPFFLFLIFSFWKLFRLKQFLSLVFFLIEFFVDVQVRFQLTRTKDKMVLLG